MEIDTEEHTANSTTWINSFHCIEKDFGAFIHSLITANRMCIQREHVSYRKRQIYARACDRKEAEFYSMQDCAVVYTSYKSYTGKEHTQTAAYIGKRGLLKATIQ